MTDIAHIAADVVGGGAKVVATAASGFSGLPLYACLAALVLAAGGGGMAVWYRMEWKSCQADAATAAEQQRDIDRADNAKAVGQLNQQLEKNKAEYQSAMERLANAPKLSPTASCSVASSYQRAVTDELCRLYPKSPACNRQQPSSKMP